MTLLDLPIPHSRPSPLGAKGAVSCFPPACADGSQPSHRMFRTFWTCGGTIMFRDDQDRKLAVNIITLRGVRHGLWRMAAAARGSERVQLSRLYAEADLALSDAVKWRLAARNYPSVSQADTSSNTAQLEGTA